jgi:oxygen-independent coproporphyrinogen III oxidase
MKPSSKAGIYIHIPFCRSKCGYCDFYSVTDTNLRRGFIRALDKEIALYARQPGFQVEYDSIYLGGGTPSLLDPQEIADILDPVRNHFTILPDTEITLEANPGTLNAVKLRELKGMGINRISIGVQSFNDRDLKLLGRIHTGRQAADMLNLVRKTGFTEVSIDLIFAIPGQSISGWRASLEQVLSFQPEHISAYNLIVEEGTPFHEMHRDNRYPFCSPEQEADFFVLTEDILAEAGYLHYEISNYARAEDHLARHNFKYWQHTPYLAFGPSAHSFWSAKRWQNTRSVDDYLYKLEHDQLPVAAQEQLTSGQILNEFILLTLRTYKGLDLQAYKSTFNEDFLDRYNRPVNALVANNLAIVNRGYFKLTARGMLLCDEIIPQFAN